MKIQVQLFAAARDAAGDSTVSVTLPENANVTQLKRQLLEDLPALKTLAASLLVAVNNEYADEYRILNATDEVACFPPVSGG